MFFLAIAVSGKIGRPETKAFASMYRARAIGRFKGGLEQFSQKWEPVWSEKYVLRQH